MNNWERDVKDKNELMKGVYKGTVPHDIFEWIKKIIWEKRRQQKQSATNHLIGHLTEEYFIKNRDKDFVPDDNFKKYESFISNCCLAKPLDNLWESNQYLDEDREIVIDTSWVNFQKKYEFNPPHDHSGVVSFVIFVQIPYDLKDEELCYPNISRSAKNRNHTSKFTFLNPGSCGGFIVDPLDVDKSFEGKMLMFSSKQMHEVYPFYTSDDYRITVSGNMKFKV